MTNPAFLDRVLVTGATPEGAVGNSWIPRRPLPKTDAWFETAWAAYRSGEIYG